MKYPTCVDCTNVNIYREYDKRIKETIFEVDCKIKDKLNETVRELWRLYREGVREIGEIPPECDKFSPEYKNMCVKCGKYLEDVQLTEIDILADNDGNYYVVCSDKCYREIKEFKRFE